MTLARIAATRSLPLALCLGAAVAAAPAAAEDWTLDPAHTRVLFRVDHAGFSRALGTFSGAEGRLRFDPQDWAGAELEVRLPLSRLDLGDADWNRRVLGRAFLDAQRHPVAHFRSTRVEPTGEGQARVTGELSLRGVTRPLVLEVTLNSIARHPLTFRRTAGFSATARLDRRDFGMDAWPNVVGQQVELWIEAEAQRGRARATPPDEEPADAADQHE